MSPPPKWYPLEYNTRALKSVMYYIYIVDQYNITNISVIYLLLYYSQQNITVQLSILKSERTIRNNQLK